MRHSRSNTAQRLMCGAAAIAILSCAGMAHAEEQRAFTIQPQSLSTALAEFGAQSGHPVMAPMDLLGSKTTRGFSDSAEPTIALAQLLDGTGLTFTRAGDTFAIVRASDPQSGSAAGDGADQGTVQALIVTAQKREEDIQDVPIAISAFTQEDLTKSQVAGGPDLVTQIPNFTFTKTNFSGYSIQIRGIGTQAISATTDPAVAVAFNNTPFIRNRFFEQEFYDLERVEVLRGPQGTLYGRNATAGVVNIISAKPKFRYEAKLSADVGNYSSSRFEGMVNVPLVADKVALRIAGAWTKRDGYATNELTGNPINGRDLWSTRLSLRAQPTDRLNVNLIWEHFQESDDRLRSGKQLCKEDEVTSVAGFPTTHLQTLPESGQAQLFAGVQASFSQGCTRASLYSPDVYQTPNGLMLPYYVPLGALNLPTALIDPYLNTFQSHDLRVIESTIDPRYTAKSDLGELQVSYDITPGLTLASETAYSRDQVFSLEDFNRFNTAPGAWNVLGSDLGPNPAVKVGILGADGVFCDPQLGCSDRLVAVDISTAKATQFSQEFRLSSDFDGPFNFSLGTNFLRADSEDKYYVFINSLSMIAAIYGESGIQKSIATGKPYTGGQTDNVSCLRNGPVAGDPSGIYPVSSCTYMDPNPIGSLNDAGHNYFLSKNPYKLISYAVFGEAYYNLTDNLKITAGLRWTVDKKDAPRIPTWILAGETYGYPVAEVIQQEWREPTGRLAIDWKPQLPFTDQSLLYASYAHGYKAGGANPPGYVYTYYADTDPAQALTQQSATRPRTFAPEFVNAFEVGSKNTILGGRATVNLSGFYYDYTGYQVSEIVDRSAFNRNFDATVWGAELESEWRPIENLKIGFKGGYEKTRIANGEQAIDLMDRTAGDPNWVVVRPFPTFASSCILPAWLFVGKAYNSSVNPVLVNLGGKGGGGSGGCELAYAAGFDPVTKAPFMANPPSSSMPITHDGPINYTAWSTNPNDYPGLSWPGGVVTDRIYPGWDPSTAPNHGEGIFKQLGGNELPNAPHWTATVTGDYTLPLPNEWLLTLHSDVHWQSQSWWRVFNDSTFDKLHPYFTMNFAAIFTNEDAGWNIMAYIKNVTDETAITGAFLNSDDTGLTTNVFLTEPRLYGLRVTKNWTGGPLLGSFGARHDGPYPLTIEVGGQVQRHDAPVGALRPSFADAMPDALDNLGAAQNRTLDWGDGREIKATWRPSAGSWSVSAAARYGKTNGATRLMATAQTDRVCGLGGPFASYCAYFGDQAYLSETNWAATTARRKEEHEIVDFAVGHDVGLGGLRQSSVGLGLRYAHFKSATHLDVDTIPNWIVPAGFVFPKYMVTHARYEAKLDSTREFKGAGPMVSWAAEKDLIGSEENGRFGVAWSIAGGVLLGRQKTSIAGVERTSLYEMNGFAPLFGYTLPPIAPPTVTPVAVSRSKSVSVPNLDLTLGLSYDIDRVQLGLGYRWERYLNALGAGDAEHKSYDRTIDGPYFKIAVGFGG